MTRELLHFRIFLISLFVFLFTVFHINVRTQVVSLGYELSELRSDLESLKKKELDLQLQKERLMSAKAVLKLLHHPRFAAFKLPQPHQIINMKATGE